MGEYHGCSQDWSEGGGPKVANVSDGGIKGIHIKPSNVSKCPWMSNIAREGRGSGHPTPLNSLRHWNNITDNGLGAVLRAPFSAPYPGLLPPRGAPRWPRLPRSLITEPSVSGGGSGPARRQSYASRPLPSPLSPPLALSQLGPTHTMPWCRNGDHGLRCSSPFLDLSLTWADRPARRRIGQVSVRGTGEWWTRGWGLSSPPLSHRPTHSLEHPGFKTLRTGHTHCPSRSVSRHHDTNIMPLLPESLDRAAKFTRLFFLGAVM